MGEKETKEGVDRFSDVSIRFYSVDQGRTHVKRVLGVIQQSSR